MALSSSICAFGRRPLIFGTETCVVSTACQIITRTPLELLRTFRAQSPVLAASSLLLSSAPRRPVCPRGALRRWKKPPMRPSADRALLDDETFETAIRLESFVIILVLTC